MIKGLSVMRSYGDDTRYSDSEKFMSGMVKPSRSYTSRTYAPKYTNKSTYTSKYSNKSTNKPKSSYKPKTTNKSTYKPKYSNKTIYAYKSTSTSANNYSTSNYDSHKRLDFYDIMCANCDTIYDTRVHKSCPTCGRIPPRIPRKYNSRSKSNGDRWIIGLYCIGILLIFIIFALMW